MPKTNDAPRSSETYEIRPLRTLDEFQACLTLQRETWGDAPGTLVPTPLLLVVQRIGGVAAGAFDPDGRLLGFVFGMTGIENGVLVHWSDMLAVRPEAREQGLGRRLKEYQREQIARVGARTIYWTYDPLVARNGWFNIVVLGAHVAEYVPDMYGDTGSPMHAGIGTDRIIVAWDVASPRAPEPDRGDPRVDPSATGDASGPDAPAVLNPRGTRFLSPVNEPARVAIEIPADIFAIRERSLDEARRWRESTREAFQWALAHRYRVVSVERKPEANRASYLLVRHRPDTAA